VRPIIRGEAQYRYDDRQGQRTTRHITFTHDSTDASVSTSKKRTTASGVDCTEVEAALLAHDGHGGYAGERNRGKESKADQSEIEEETVAAADRN